MRHIKPSRATLGCILRVKGSAILTVHCFKPREIHLPPCEMIRAIIFSLIFPYAENTPADYLATTRITVVAEKLSPLGGGESCNFNTRNISHAEEVDLCPLTLT